MLAVPSSIDDARGWWGQAMAQPVGPWCRPRVASRARLMALARVRMSVRMRLWPRQRA